MDKVLHVFPQQGHPREMGADEVQATITYLANERHVAVSTRNQVLSAIVSWYKYVLQKEVFLASGIIRLVAPTHPS